MKLIRPVLGFLTVVTLGITPVVSPMEPFSSPAQAAGCTPTESTFTGDGSNGTLDVEYTVLTFTATGSCEWTVPAGVTEAAALIVGGGGGGGGGVSVLDRAGGSGGGGGYVVDPLLTNLSSPLTIVVGGGGAGGTSGNNGVRGGTSSIQVATLETFSALGGTGGSRGGVTTATRTGGKSAYNQNVFDAGATSKFGGGGGSGAGENGDGNGPGGSGHTSSITGTSTSYAGGGAGGGNDFGDVDLTLGGAGGGGNGALNKRTFQTATRGTNGLGGGGGGGADQSPYQNGAAGGSGVVIIRYSLGPGAPTISSVAAGDGSIDVTFSEPAHTGGSSITGYQYSIDGTNWTTLSTAAGTHTITGLTNGTAYTLQLRTVNGSGPGEVATSSSVTPKAPQTITFPSIAAKTYGDSSVTASVSVDSPLTVTVASADTSVCTVSGTTVSIDGVGTCSLTASQAGNDLYNAAPDVTQSFTISPKAITMSVAFADKSYDGLTSATVSGTPVLTGVVGTDDVQVDVTKVLGVFSSETVGSGKTVSVSLAAGVLTGTHAARYTVTVSNSPTASITKATQSPLSISVDDSALSYGDTATLSSSGGDGTGAVTFSVDSGDCSISGTTVTATGGATDCVISAVKAADLNYLQASSANTVTISISKAAQTITFASISNATYGASAFSVSPTSDSGLAVSISSSTPLVCATSGLTVTVVGVGTCSLTANQAGNSFYSSATGVTRSFTVSAKAITVSVAVADKVYDATTSATVASGTLSGVVSGDVVSFVAGNAVAAFGSATVGSGKAVTVTLDGDELTGSDAGNYSLTVSGAPTGSITAKPVTVNVVPAGKTYDGTQTVASFTTALVGVESSDTVTENPSKISVTFDAPGAGTQSASATLAAGVLTGTDAGNYAASVGTVSSAVITKADQASLSFTSSSSTLFGQTLTLVATGGSGSGVITYSASGDCTITGAVITPTGAGSCSVSATRAADANYNISSQATQTVTISKANQSINFTSSVPVFAVAGTTYTPTATATSGLAPTFSITTGNGTVCSIASGVVTFLTSGTCVIEADQAGNTNYNAATTVSQTIVAGKINQTITFPSISGKDFDDAAFLAGATVSSGRTVTFATSTGSVCGVNASTGLISIKTVGDCTVTASSAGDSTYAAASDVSRTFTISPVLAGKPSVTSVSFGNSSVTVAFTAPGANGGDSIDAYQVVATSSGGSVTKPDCSTTSPCTITGLTNGDSYTLTVAAINAAGVGPASDASPAITPATIPDAVSALSTTPGDTQLAVNWTPLTNAQLGGGSFTRYDVSIRVRGQAWSSPVTADGTNNLGTQATSSYTFTGLTNGTAYDVKVVALTSVNGTALSSNTATALGVPATAPDAPTGLTLASLSNTSAVASWTAPVDDGGSSITAYSVNLSCTFVNATDTFCELSGLTGGSTVTVTVGATNLMGTGSTVTATITMPGGGSGGSSGSSGRSTPTTTRVVTPTVVTPTLPGTRVLPRPPVQTPRILNAPVVTPTNPPGVNEPVRVLVGGRPVPTLTEARGASEVNIRAGTIDLGLGATTPSATSTVRTNPTTNAPELTVGSGESTSLNVTGLLPGSTLQVWLPGADGRELARVPVNPDGSVTEEISLTAPRTETPLPLGRQVLQVTGFDEDGNQTVVDMTINIAQGAPSPELNRLTNELPDLQPGQSLATSAGVPETVTISANAETGEVSVVSNEWSFTVTVPESNGTVDAENPSAPTIRLIQARTAEVNGGGFQPDTRVDIFLFSDPTLLGSFTVGADGSLDAEIFLDARFAGPGDHTLQIQGVGTDGYVKAANLGVLVEEPPAPTTASQASLMLWWAVGAFLLALVLLLFGLARRRRRET